MATFKNLEVEARAAQLDLRSDGTRGKTSAGFAVHAHATLDGGATARFTVTDRTFQSVSKDQRSLPEGLGLQFRTADGSAKIDVDLASLKSVIETKKTQLVGDKEVAFRMHYRQAAGECDVEATHLVDSNISITAGYALHAQHARVKGKIVMDKTVLEPYVNLHTQDWSVKGTYNVSINDKLTATVFRTGDPVVGFTHSQDGMDFGVTCPLRGNDVMANLAFKINRTIEL